MKGNHQSKFYICANVMGDFPEQYKRLFAAEFDGLHFSYGDMVFRTFNNDVQSLLGVIQDKFCQGSVVEIHGIAPDRINIGIYVYNEAELINPFLQKCFVAKHIGDGYFQRLEIDH